MNTLLILLLFAIPPLTKTLTLQWDYDPALTGTKYFNVYYRNGGAFNKIGQVDRNTTTTIQSFTTVPFAPGTHTFRVTAHDGLVESEPSNEDKVILLEVTPMATNLTSTTAQVAWRTEIETDGRIEYWLLGGTPKPHVTNTVLSTDHVAKLSSLTGKRVYQYKVYGRSNAGGEDYQVIGVGTFITK